MKYVLFLGISAVFTMLVAKAFFYKPYYHIKTAEGWKTVFRGTGLALQHSSNIETEDEAEACFEDIGDFKPLAVAGICFHLMQQLGGKLTYHGWEVRACHFDDCSGEPLDEYTVVNIEHPGGNFESMYAKEIIWNY